MKSHHLTGCRAGYLVMRSRFSFLMFAGAVAIAATGSCAPARPPTRADDRPATTQPAVPLTKPALAPLTQPAYGLSNVVEQTLPAQPAFAHVSVRTTVRTLSASIDGAMAELFKHPDLGPQIVGPSILVYRGVTPSLDQPFVLEVGFPVREAFQPTGAVKVRPLPALHCLTAEFTGPVRAIDKAYDRLLPTVAARKLRQSGETREVYLRWDGPDSENNQILVAVGVR